MRKIGALIITVALLAVALPIMADTTVSGEFQYFVTTDFGDVFDARFQKAELNITGEVDEYNTVKLELDSEGDDFNTNVAVDDFRLESEIGAALGLPLDITYTVGYFDTYFTGWYNADREAWTGHATNWPNGVVNMGPVAAGAHQLDIGVGPAVIHWYNSFAKDFMVGLSAEFDFGLETWLAYGNTKLDAVGDGTIAVEASYGMDMGDLSLTVPVQFHYNLGADEYTYQGGVKVGYGMFSFNAGLEGDETDALDNVAIDLGAEGLLEGLDLWSTVFFDFGSTNAFTAVELEASYAIGAAKLIMGYVIPGKDMTAVPIFGNATDSLLAEGLYFGVDIDF
jgi:hypothetical protein